MANVPISLPAESESTRTLRHVFSVIVRDPLSLMSTVIIVLFVVIAIFANQIAPYPLEGAGKTNADNSLLTPSSEHLLGTDKLGRDLLSRIIIGARPALIVPMGVVFFAILIGWVSCFQGFFTVGGSLGVGRFTTRAVAFCYVAVIVSDTILTKIILTFWGN